MWLRIYTNQHRSQLVARLLDSGLIAVGGFAGLYPFLDALPLLAVRSQFSGEDELNTEQHHAVGNGDGVAHEKLAAAFGQFFFQEVHVLDDIDAHGFRNLLDRIGVRCAEPTCVEDCKTM